MVQAAFFMGGGIGKEAVLHLGNGFDIYGC